MPGNLSPRTPVLVGLAQLEQRTDDFTEAKEPLELMVDAVRAAAEDAGCTALLEQTDAVRVIRGIWRYGDPGRVIAERVGCPKAKTAITPFGGNFVQTVLNRTALDIQAGHLDVAILTGAECGKSYALARKAGARMDATDCPGDPDEQIGKDTPMWFEAEKARNIMMPIQMYPIFENALRHARGESPEEHSRRVSELWAGFNAVATKNPHAWIRESISAEEIRTPSTSNRMVGFPYPKLMNSNSHVDQSAALILCSLEKARSLGISQDRFVFPHVGTDAHDTPAVSHRDELHRSPGMRLAGRRALELAEVEVTDLEHVDVYSCFPSAVQVAAEEIGLPLDRPLTVTGGLTFGGGPMNNYVMHAIARMAQLLREAPGKMGLCTANGGFLTKHAFGVYSTAPPEKGYQHEDLQAQVDALPAREATVDWDGEATIESYTVMFDADGPTIGHTACRLADGRRTWANVEDRDTMTAMTREEFCGRRARIDGQGRLTVTG
ncbi:MAG: acetyl-CoA acetyltransferase [Deltaproteobacteria bacterium]|nr:acetyl-CoA acetyltransferase [Deltaproteobacteria bacterium]